TPPRILRILIRSRLKVVESERPPSLPRWSVRRPLHRGWRATRPVSLKEPLAAFATTLLAILAVASRAVLDRVDRHPGRVFPHVPPNAPALAALNVGEPPLHFLEIASAFAHRHLLPDWEIDPHIQRSGPGAEAHFVIGRATSHHPNHG